MPNLQTLLDAIPFASLPPAWSAHDLAPFSRDKQLWDYQQEALRAALKALWRYYDAATADGDKERFYQWYQENDVPLDAALPLGKKRDNALLLDPYYPVSQPSDGKKGAESEIAYAQLINRMGFWMATGSGKTLVIIKLLELLWTLMDRGLIPRREVMVLTHRDDLLRQIQQHAREFNAAGRAPALVLHELRNYAAVKRANPSLYAAQELPVFFYRSDNLSDEQKERIIDFRSYENGGQWYLLLDEAHKGDKQDSKRQHIYNILSRDGFLFNFSATFTDSRDKLTTAYEFNLASFIAKGYGKHISLLRQENRAFRDEEDFNDEEKQRIVLQALLALAYAAKSREKLAAAVGQGAYHRPLLLTLVNSVNTDESDLKLFFRELERIGRGALTDAAFDAAKKALRDELAASPEWLYEDAPFSLDAATFDSLTLADARRYLFNAASPGEIEVLVRPSNSKELALKLKSAAAPFALIKIGDISGWLKTELAGYEINKGFSDETFFARLNDDDSAINLLLGSRSFYEGWDSNRPNVITFINIGVGADAQKFILQAVGRGVRLEPLPGKRKRLANLRNSGEVDSLFFGAAKQYLAAVETLFIFGTRRQALATIFGGLETEKREREAGELLALTVNSAALSPHYPILIPTYRDGRGRLLMEREPRKFALLDEELTHLQEYVAYLGDDRLLLAHHNLSPTQIRLLRRCLDEPESYFNANDARPYGRMDIILGRLGQYVDVIPREFDAFKPLEDEINHFQRIRVTLTDLSELRRKIHAVQMYRDPTEQKRELKKQFNEARIDIDQYTEAVERLAGATPAETFEHNGHKLEIKHIAAHYYLPLLLSESEKIDYISHIIRTPSEVAFIKSLEEYLKQDDNGFKAYDWWLFSRTDETTDRIVVPYYDPASNAMRQFHPDFIFWLAKGNAYTIYLVDPKGMAFSDYQHKVEGYKRLFQQRPSGDCKTFLYGEHQVQVKLGLYTRDASVAPAGYRPFWFDNPAEIARAGER